MQTKLQEFDLDLFIYWRMKYIQQFYSKSFDEREKHVSYLFFQWKNKDK